MTDIYRYLQLNGYDRIEGNCGGCEEQMKDLIAFTRKENINIMEIGFNAGNSSEVFLKNNLTCKVTSFDIGTHDYVIKCKEYIDKNYPNRHTLILGDSTLTVREFIQNNKDGIKFDFIFIDGGHTYEVAKTDITNCFDLAHEDTIVALDDTVFTKEWQSFWNVGPTTVWQEFVSNKKIVEFFSKDYSDGRGMSCGKYVFNTNN